MKIQTGILFLSIGLLAAEKLPIPAGKAGLPKSSAAAQKTEQFVPVMEGNSISAGSKKIQLVNNFQITITESGRTLAETAYVFTLTDKKTGKTTWHSLGTRRPGMYKTESNGNKRIFEQKFSIGNYTWDFARQETELLPNGLVQVTFTWKNPDPEKYLLKQYGLFFNIPYSVGGGKRIVCDFRTLRSTTSQMDQETNPIRFSFSRRTRHELSQSPEKRGILRGSPVSP